MHQLPAADVADLFGFIELPVHLGELPEGLPLFGLIQKGLQDDRLLDPPAPAGTARSRLWIRPLRLR